LDRTREKRLQQLIGKFDEFRKNNNPYDLNSLKVGDVSVSLSLFVVKRGYTSVMDRTLPFIPYDPLTIFRLYGINNLTPSFLRPRIYLCVERRMRADVAKGVRW